MAFTGLREIPPIVAPPSGPAEGYPQPLEGNPDELSIADYCAALPKRRYGSQAKGKLLYFPHHQLVMVPFEMTSNGFWNCCVVMGDPKGFYAPGGYNLVVGETEIETALEVPVARFAQMAMDGTP